jgi:hypothetical protein
MYCAERAPRSPAHIDRRRAATRLGLVVEAPGRFASYTPGMQRRRREAITAARRSCALVALATMAGCGAPAHPAALPYDDAAPVTDDAVTWLPSPDAVSDATPPATGPAILFLGNSYTFVNDLPGMTASLTMAIPGHAGATVDSTTVGGATLQQLIDTTDAMTKVKSGKFTHVVLQEQSVTPCMDPTSYVAAVTTLANAAHAVHAQVLIYGTWPRAPGDAVYMQPWSGGNPTAFEACLEAGFAKAVAASGGTLVDVGAAWVRVQTERPGFALYQSDGSHPLVAGTYLGALSFTRAVMGVSASSISTHPSGVSDADASFLASVVDGH